MSSNFKDLKIETINGKIQNVSSLCGYIKNTNITEEDLPYLESLRNKLANDDTSENIYTNEYPLVDTLEEVLLEYYINNYHYDLDNIIDLLEIYNHAFMSLDKIKYDGLIYLINDKYNDLDIIDVEDENKVINIILSNLRIFIKGSLEEIFDILSKKLHRLDFIESNDDIVKEYANRFNIDDPIYYAKDMHNNRLFKIKNGLLVKHNNEINTLVTPTLVEKEEHTVTKVIKKNKKYKAFDIEDFITLKNKMFEGDIESEAEVQRFYYEVRYLINTMNQRNEDDELTHLLDEYMSSLNKIYENHPEILSKADKNNVESYLNKKKRYSKVA